MRKTHTTYLMSLMLLVVTLLVAFGLRASNLQSFPPGLSNDEAVNVIDAFHIAHSGNFPLYQDQGRPEPLFRLVQAAGLLLYGEGIWTFRLTSAFVGLLTVAAAYWAASECLRDVPRGTRQIAALAGAVVIAVAIGHVTVTRSTYRAVPQPLLMLLMTGFLLRGLRLLRWRDSALAGLFGALGVYTYTAAYVIPLGLLPLGLHLLISKRRQWRAWLPRLIMTGLVIVLLLIPVILIVTQTPEAVLGRAATVSEGRFNLQSRLMTLAEMFFTNGDENPQYNAAQAPLLPGQFASLFVIGLAALIIRFRQPSSVWIAALMVLAAVPAFATAEVGHGLRIVGEYAVIPLVVAVGTSSLLVLLQWQMPPGALHRGAIILLAVLLGLEGISTLRTYSVYWTQPEKWQSWTLHGRSMTHSEWFFRTDRRAFAEWLAEQDGPLLVPVRELSRQTTRSWLLGAYPEVRAAGADLSLPEDTRIVAPWALERDGLLHNEQQYALLDGGVIILLPPLSDAAHNQLMAAIDAGEVIPERAGSMDIIGQIAPLPADFALDYVPYAQTETFTPISFDNDEMRLVGWRGPDTLTGDEQTLSYTLDWVSERRIGHEYWAYLQLQTQDFERVAGEDHHILRWLYPTSIWQTDVAVPVPHKISVSASLPTGAYRLVTGLYPTIGDPLRVDGGPAGQGASIGWVKVPQYAAPVVAADAERLDASLSDQFQLLAATADSSDAGSITVTLYWQSLVQRPPVDATIFVHLLQERGAPPLAQHDARPWDGQYPTFIWDEGEIVATQHTLNTDGLNLNGAFVAVGMYTQPDFTRLQVTQNGADVPENIVNLGTVSALLAED